VSPEDVRIAELDAYADEMTEQARNALDPAERHELAEEALFARAAAARLRGRV
jgi:hypothetical protein